MKNVHIRFERTFHIGNTGRELIGNQPYNMITVVIPVYPHILLYILYDRVREIVELDLTTK